MQQKQSSYKIILVVLLTSFLFSSNCLFAQEDIKQKFSLKDRLFTGGNLGLQFGNPTMIEIAPLVGFKITKQASAGVGATYLYYKYSDLSYKVSFISNIYGGRVFAQHTIWRSIFAHAEYEVLNGEWIYGSRYNIESILVGGGYRQTLFGNTCLNFMILWNFNGSYNSPYTNPIIRGGISVGL